MAKRLTVELEDGEETWIELSAVITRRAEQLMWDEGLSADEAIETVLADAVSASIFSGESEDGEDSEDAEDESED